MAVHPPRPGLAWLFGAPLLLGAGVAIGSSWRSVPPESVWTEARQPDRTPLIPSLAPVVREVRNGVVGVRTMRRASAPPPDDGMGDLVGDASAGVVRGSGFVVHERGLVVTNYHLVSDFEQISIDILGHRSRVAVLLAADPITDLAVLRIDDPPADLHVLELGDSSRVEQGDWVMAMGHPFLYRHSVTVGVVSYVGRHVPDEMVSNEFLQFSAAVNPGSSGGPVFDLRGHVVGLTTSTAGAGTGIAFAVPSKVIRWVLERAEAGDTHVRRGYLGVRLQPLSAAAREAPGVLIVAVKQGAPAERAGLQAGDVVRRFDDVPVADPSALFNMVSYGRPGADIDVEVLREGKEERVRVQLGRVAAERPVMPPVLATDDGAPAH